MRECGPYLPPDLTPQFDQHYPFIASYQHVRHFRTVPLVNSEIPTDKTQP